MSEFDAFGAADAPQQEEDPAADFLAREQDQLAGLEDDNVAGDAGQQQQEAAPAQYDFMSDYMAEAEKQEAEEGGDSGEASNDAAATNEQTAPAGDFGFVTNLGDSDQKETSEQDASQTLAPPDQGNAQEDVEESKNESTPQPTPTDDSAKDESIAIDNKDPETVNIDSVAEESASVDPPAAPAGGDDFMAQFGSDTTTQEPAADSNDMFSAAPVSEEAPAQASNDDIMAQFGSSEPAATTDTSNDFFVAGGFLGEEAQVPPSLDIFHAPGESNTDDFMGGGGAVIDDLDQRLNQEDGGSSDPYSSVRGFDAERAEPEKLRVWREEQGEMIEKKDAEEAEQMAEWREVAKKELDDWYKHRAEQFEKTKKNNREGEAEFIKERDDTLPGHEWERICRVCEFNPKSNRSQKDSSRMRSILLQLKQNPIAAQ